MKILAKILGGVIASFLIVSTVSAQGTATVTVTVTPVKPVTAPPFVSLREFMTQVCTNVGYGIPEVYKQLPLKILNVKRSESLYSALQKCVYLGFLANSPIRYQWDRPVGTKFVNLFIGNAMSMDPGFDEEQTDLSRKDFSRLINALPSYKALMLLAEKSRRGSNSNFYSPVIDSVGFSNLTEVYRALKSDYRSGDRVDDNTLIRGAIKGMSESVGDIHTVYFPPAEAKDFNNQLEGNFEGIGAYLDVVKLGEIIITSVLKDTPAQSAGLMANDRILGIDKYTISEKDTLESVIAKIKGPAGTKVTLTIRRDGTTHTFTLTRAKIVLSLLDYEVKSGVPVITIHTFGRGVAQKWVEALTNHKNEIANSNKLIIDLRNNPGGSLQEVAEMLNDFVPAGQPVVVTRSRYEEENIVSEGRSLVNFSQKKIVILVDSSTASASEIMAGTMKDYMPANVTIIGDTTYGKGSVQYLQSFDDGSSFKMTVSHRYTGKTKKIIDGVGIVPDVKIILDLQKYRQGFDNQMDAALKY